MSGKFPRVNGEDLWGLTASYSVNFYDAHRPGNDTGVISSHAAVSFYRFTRPEESMKVIQGTEMKLSG